MIKINWYYGEVSDNLEVRQVYGVLFTTDGRVLLKVETKKDKQVYSLAGGTPENYDKDRIATLKRELIEEVNTEIFDNIFMIGYQTISGDGNSPDYAQIRMTALIKNINVKKPDPDNGEIYDRLLTSPQNAIKLLNWGDVGEKLINEACKIAKEKYNISFDQTQDKWV